jgi:MoxR-like ATPase
MEAENLFSPRIGLSPVNASVEQIRMTIGQVIKGQRAMTDLLITAILSDGHVLIEGVPGIAKTLTAKVMAKCLDTGFSRIQFTPDLMPSDIIGTSVFNLSKSTFEFNKGPIFSNIILIDEINRSPAKTQAALFEVMEERQISADGTTYNMESPFMVIATQNPIEHEGTYRLPEAQLDRFLFRINVGYPTVEEETSILKAHHEWKGVPPATSIKPVISAAEITEFRKVVKSVVVEEKIMDFITRIIRATRENSSLLLGASPRAGVHLMNAGQAYAVMNGRDFVTPEDIIFLVNPVLNHRILLTADREMEGIRPEDILNSIVTNIEIPR